MNNIFNQPKFVVLLAVCTITNIIVSMKQNINNNLKHVPLKLNKNNQVIVIHVTNILNI